MNGQVVGSRFGFMSPGEGAQDIAIRPLVAKDREALLRTILNSTDYAVMLTDLDHVTIALNAKFGQIFQCDIQHAVHSGVTEVREMVADLIPDIDEWNKNLVDVYENPEWTQEDELLLLHRPPIAVRRWTGPVRDGNGDVVGRLWTFRDVSRESRSRRMREALYDVSVLFDNDPRTVYQSVVESVAKFYGTNAVLSILVGETMEFRAVASEIQAVRESKSNLLKDSYCQFTMRKKGPVLIQNATDDLEARDVLPARHGFTRYLGVPVNEPGGQIIGTLCFLDDQSDQPIDEEDAGFMSMMAMKVSSELARENFMLERVAEKQRVVESQNRDLETTRQVLQAINSAFELTACPESTANLVKGLVSLLHGLIGYDQVGIFLEDQTTRKLSGFVVSAPNGKPEEQEAETALSLGLCFGAGSPVVVPLRNLPDRDAFLVMGSTGVLPQRNGHHEAHLEAIVEQVSLSLRSHLLQAQLAQAYETLKDAHAQLVQSEKLSVIGTLAASTAHDIKNILASVSIELGMGHEDPEKALASVKQHMDRFTVLAHRLLSYAKPRLVAMQPVSPQETLQRVLALTAAHARITNVTTICQGLESLPHVTGDPHQLEHLFVNLVMNAVQAMHGSGGTLTITGNKTPGGVTIEVRDTGKGIDRQTMERLFEPFASSRNEGFGLGLYSCKRIAEEHGGDIGVKCQTGEGTAFLVTLRTSG